MKLNGILPENYPKLETEDIESLDLGELGEFINKVVGAGMPLFPDTEVENFIRGQAGLPLLPENNQLDVEGTGEFEDNTQDGSQVENPEEKPEESEQPAGEIQKSDESKDDIGFTLKVVKAVNAKEITRKSGVGILMTLLGASKQEAEKVLG